MDAVSLEPEPSLERWVACISVEHEDGTRLTFDVHEVDFVNVHAEAAPEGGRRILSPITRQMLTAVRYDG